MGCLVMYGAALRVQAWSSPNSSGPCREAVFERREGAIASFKPKVPHPVFYMGAADLSSESQAPI